MANNASQHATRYLVSLFDKVRLSGAAAPTAARPPDQERKKQARSIRRWQETM